MPKNASGQKLELDSRAEEPPQKFLVHCLVPDRPAPTTHSALTGLLQNVSSTPPRRIIKYLRWTSFRPDSHPSEGGVPCSVIATHCGNCVHPATGTPKVLREAPRQSRKIFTKKRDELGLEEEAGEWYRCWDGHSHAVTDFTVPKAMVACVAGAAAHLCLPAQSSSMKDSQGLSQAVPGSGTFLS